MNQSSSKGKSSAALVSATGRDYAEWFQLLDTWGAPGRGYREIADWLVGQGVSDWWTQKLIVEYEQDRGLRQPGARTGGWFAGGASKTVPVSIGVAGRSGGRACQARLATSAGRPQGMVGGLTEQPHLKLAKLIN